MAVTAFAGNFAITTSAENQSITGVGFQPDVVLFFPTINTADGVNVDAHASIGVGVSSTDRRAATANSEDAQGTSDAHRESSSSLCILVNVEGTATALIEADFVSQDADGFTISVSTAPASAFRIGFLALGGADLTDVVSGVFSAATADGNQSVSGVGFQPEAMLAFGISHTSEAATGTMKWNLGCAVSSTKRWAMVVNSQNGQGTTNTDRRGSSSAVYLELGGDGAERAVADFVSFDADGFTWDWSNAPGTADQVYYVCFAGGQYDAGEIQSQTSTGNFSTTGVGFQPAAGLWGSVHVADTSITTGNEMSMGVASGSTEQFGVGENSENAQGASDDDSYSDDNEIYLNYDFNQAIEGSARFVSFDADGFTLNETDADPSELNIYYFVIGSDAATTTTTTTTTVLAVPVEKRTDDLMYIEQVIFREPYSLQLVGGDDERLSIFLKQRGLPGL